MIYDCADHRNDADITATWQQLLESTHLKVHDDPNASQQPYEAVVTMMKDMADRLNHSETTFNPHTLIPMIERYALEHQNNVGPRTWVPDLFIDVQFPYDTIVSVLQGMWFSNLAPFTSRSKGILAVHIIYVCEQWFHHCISTNQRLYGSDDNAQDISEVLDQLRSQVSGDEQQKVDELRRNIDRSFR